MHMWWGLIEVSCRTLASFPGHFFSKRTEGPGPGISCLPMRQSLVRFRRMYILIYFLWHLYSCTNRTSSQCRSIVLDIDRAMAKGEALSSLKLGLELEQVKAINYSLNVMIWIVKHWSGCCVCGVYTSPLVSLIWWTRWRACGLEDSVLPSSVPTKGLGLEPRDKQ